MRRYSVLFVAVSAVLSAGSGTLMPGQATTAAPQVASQSPAAVADTAEVLGITPVTHRLSAMQAERSCSGAPTLEEIGARLELMEAVTTASLDVDGVLAEIANERMGLSELQAQLQGRRDRTVGLLNVANLITGTGVGIAVNAMQFSDRTATWGDGVGVGSGVASTVLSLVGIRRQNGPQHGIGQVPNMLAPLFDRPPALNTYYPPEVLRYLNGVAPGQNATEGTRLAQLNAEWVKAGRIDAGPSAKHQQKIEVLTASMSKTARASISDLQDRSAMLGDVAGRVSLMQRDMAALMRSYRTPASCQP